MGGNWVTKKGAVNAIHTRHRPSSTTVNHTTSKMAKLDKCGHELGFIYPVCLDSAMGWDG